MKWFSLGLGALLGVSHIGMIGMIASRKSYPVIHPPLIGPYTSYVVSASKDGYKMSYVGNDPKTMYKTCLLYTSPSPRDVEESRMPSSA